MCCVSRLTRRIYITDQGSLTKLNTFQGSMPLLTVLSK